MFRNKARKRTNEKKKYRNDIVNAPPTDFWEKWPQFGINGFLSDRYVFITYECVVSVIYYFWDVERPTVPVKWISFYVYYLFSVSTGRYDIPSQSMWTVNTWSMHCFSYIVIALGLDHTKTGLPFDELFSTNHHLFIHWYMWDDNPSPKRNIFHKFIKEDNIRLKRFRLVGSILGQSRRIFNSEWNRYTSNIQKMLTACLWRVCVWLRHQNRS